MDGDPLAGMLGEKVKGIIVDECRALFRRPELSFLCLSSTTYLVNVGALVASTRIQIQSRLFLVFIACTGSQSQVIFCNS